MHSILVADYMDPQPLTILQHSNIIDAVELLLKHQMTGAPVVDENKQLVGFLSEQDCIKEMLNDAFYCEEPANVAKLMKTEVITTTPQTSIVEIAQLVIVNVPKNYPVIENGKLVGLIKRRDILKALLENNEDCYLRVSSGK